jgi:hypothetical protein
MPVDTTSPCPVAAVNTSPSAMSPPPLRRRFPCPDVLPGCRAARAEFSYG